MKDFNLQVYLAMNEIRKQKYLKSEISFKVPQDRLITEKVGDGTYKVLIGRFNVPSFKPNNIYNVDKDILKQGLDSLLNNPIGELSQHLVDERTEKEKLTVVEVMEIRPPFIAGTLLTYEIIEKEKEYIVYGVIEFNQQAIDLIESSPHYLSVRSIAKVKNVNGVSEYSITSIHAFDLEAALFY